MNRSCCLLALLLFFSFLCLFACGDDSSTDSTGSPQASSGQANDDDDASDNDDAPSASSGQAAVDDDDDQADDDSADDDAADDDDCPADFFPYSPVDQPGPYAVGVATVYLKDDERFEWWGLRPRELPMEIWYPSTGQNGRPNTMADMIGEIPEWGYELFDQFYGESFDELMTLETGALRNADVLLSDCPYPIVIFSHGIMAIRIQNYTLCEHLASHGFIVAAPDHYGNAVFTNVSGPGVIVYNPVSTILSYFDRPVDTHLVYEYLTSQTKNPDSPWYGQMDLDRIAMSGHSYGGLTSLFVGPYYDYVKAIAPLNPAWVGIFPQGFDKPFFMLQAEIDKVVGEFNETPKALFDHADSEEKLFINLIRGSHYSATDACVLLPPGYISPSTSGCEDESFIDPALANEITCGYLTAFFKSTLLQDGRYEDFLRENRFTDEIEFSSTWEQQETP